MTRPDERFCISPCGYLCDWFKPADVPADWTDATDLDDAQMSRLIRDRIHARQIAQVEFA